LRRAAAEDRAGGGEAHEPVVVLAAVEWSYRFQRPQQLARALSRRGHPTLYVEAFARARVQPPYFAAPTAEGPLALALRLPGRPDPYRSVLEAPAAARAAELVASGLRRRPAFILIELPFWLELALELRRRLGAPVVYDRLDWHSGFAGVTAAVADAERQLLERCDLVAASAQDLVERSTAASSQPVILLRNAVALEDFPPAPSPAPGAPRVGYVGALGPWFDAAAVGALAARHPSWAFELAGRVETREVAALGQLPNVHLLGEIAYREVPAFLSRLHVLLIPFHDQPLTRAVDPVKLYEGLAVGVPVVARDLPETRRWPAPLVHLYREPAALAPAVAAALAADSPEVRAARRAAVAGETWAARALALAEAVAAQNGLPKLRKTT
jgi:glycosyltransferase involved in cell wall biosynthesis